MNKKLQSAKPDDFSLTTNLNQASEAGSHDIDPDITEREQVETERERLLAAEREQRLLAETLAEATLALTAQTSHTAVLEEILRQVQRVVPCE